MKKTVLVLSAVVLAVSIIGYSYNHKNKKERKQVILRKFLPENACKNLICSN